MEQNFLLTYTLGIHTGYNWFESEEELKEFVLKMEEAHGSFTFIINEALEISHVREINL